MVVFRHQLTREIRNKNINTNIHQTQNRHRIEHGICDIWYVTTRRFAQRLSWPKYFVACRPVMVPPVLTGATNTSTWPWVSSQISMPVSSHEQACLGDANQIEKKTPDSTWIHLNALEYICNKRSKKTDNRKQAEERFVLDLQSLGCTDSKFFST